MNELVGTQRGHDLQGSDRARAEVPERPTRRQSVDEVAIGWNHIAILLAVTAATVAGIWSLQPYAQAGVTSMVACYVALANDLTPLLYPGAPDAAASSTECAPQTTTEEGRHRDASVVGSRAGNGEPTTPLAPTHRRGNRLSASATAALPSSSSARAASNVCRDDANIVGDLISQCDP